ncbi:CAP domain-containing protein, partial [Cereibacter changlensis]
VCPPSPPRPGSTRWRRPTPATWARRGRMGHDGSDGSNLGQRLGRGGYRFGLAAENIAHGFDSVVAVTQSWMQSPGHRANILRPAATDLGVGVAQPAGGRPYWVLLLAAPL